MDLIYPTTIIIVTINKIIIIVIIIIMIIIMTIIITIIRTIVSIIIITSIITILKFQSAHLDLVNFNLINLN